jgi:hypothetical protein
VYAFDGSPELYPIVPFTESNASVTSGVERLRTFKPKDPSTNLRGAVVEALKTLRSSLDADPKPLKFGTLVVFTDGTDRANRVSKEDLDKALNDAEHKSFDIFAIGVGAEMNNSRLEDIGRTETVKETDKANTGKAFDKVAEKVEGMTARYYLLSYCTPSRAGEHTVRIEAHGPSGGSGSLTYKFKADGFGPTCDPNTPPDFDLAHPPAPKDEDNAKKGIKIDKKDEKKEEKKDDKKEHHAPAAVSPPVPAPKPASPPPATTDKPAASAGESFTP